MITTLKEFEEIDDDIWENIDSEEELKEVLKMTEMEFVEMLKDSEDTSDAGHTPPDIMDFFIYLHFIDEESNEGYDLELSFCYHAVTVGLSDMKVRIPVRFANVSHCELH